MKISSAWAATAMAMIATAAAAQGTGAGNAMPVTYSLNFDPTLSPDGKRMIFLKVFEGREQMFIADVDGSHERQLSHDVANIEDPAWSPEGLHIAYVRIEDGHNRIHVMNLDGSGDRPVTPASQTPIHPHWTPDSRSILYCTTDDLDPPRKNSAEIYRLDLVSGKLTTLISGGVNTYPTQSPDGKFIAFRRMIDTNSEVFIAGASGEQVRNLTDDPAFDGWPSWSPDSKRIAFASNRNSSYQIFVMNADGTRVTLVANTEGRATAPTWSPDGRTIYFTNCWKTGLKSACEIFAAPAPGP